MNYNEETIAIVALLHDLCKINCYKQSMRNVKENGQWIQVPFYEFQDTLPYGHGEKSVYMISGYMRLKREEPLRFVIIWDLLVMKMPEM